MAHARTQSLAKYMAMLAVMLASALIFTAPVHSQESSILNGVLERGTLRIATVGGNPPYSSLNPSGEWEGYDIDIGKMIAASLKVKPEFIIIDNPGRVTALQTGRADVSIANFTNTMQRSTAVAFTNPYMVGGTVFVVLKDSPIKSAEDLNDPKIKISFPRGGTNEQTVERVVPKATKLRFDTTGDALLALKSGQADAQLQDAFQNSAFLAKDPNLQNLPGKWSYEEIGIGVPAGDFDWWRIVDTWVRQFNGSGQNALLFKKYFGFDLPPIK